MDPLNQYVVHFCEQVLPRTVASVDELCDIISHMCASLHGGLPVQTERLHQSLCRLTSNISDHLCHLRTVRRFHSLDSAPSGTSNEAWISYGSHLVNFVHNLVHFFSRLLSCISSLFIVALPGHCTLTALQHSLRSVAEQSFCAEDTLAHCELARLAFNHPEYMQSIAHALPET